MKIKLTAIITGLSVLILSQPCSAQTVKTGVEPFPPLIVDKSTGYTIDLLKAIEAVSDLKFDIRIMSYTRAKYDLKRSESDMIAHTPYRLETDDFYAYALELDWNMETRSDLFAMSDYKFNKINNLLIGIPRGNKEFAAELLGLPAKNFYESSIENLLEMLQKGRIDAFWFERASTMTMLKKLKISNVFYMKMPKDTIPVGIAVQKNDKGLQLKDKIDSLIKKIDQEKLFKDYSVYLKMPDSGVFKISEK